MSEETVLEQSDSILKMQDFLQVVSFNLHKEEYAVEITKVKEIILLEGVTKVPQMPEFIEGIINLRGIVIPVIDLRKRFGLPCPEPDDHTRIVVTRMEDRIVGLIVNSVSQVMKIPQANIQPPPDTIAGLAGEYLTGVGKVDDRLIILLDIEKIMSADEMKYLSSSSVEKEEPPKKKKTSKSKKK